MSNLEQKDSVTRGVASLTERFFGRVGAIAAGLGLMFGGIGLGVTVVLLPAGVIVGFIGLFLFLYGLFAPAFRRQEG